VGDDVIRASEIGQYAYCARAWWLARVKGLPSANAADMRAGTEQHQEHGRAVERLYFLRRLAAAFIFLGVLLLLAWLVMGLVR